MTAQPADKLAELDGLLEECKNVYAEAIARRDPLSTLLQVKLLEIQTKARAALKPRP